MTRDESEPGRVGTWILAFFLAVLAVVTVASLGHCLQRVYPDKGGVLLEWLDNSVLKEVGANNSSVASVMPSQKKVPRRACCFR